MIRIALSARAYRAIKTPLPPVTIVYPIEHNARIRTSALVNGDPEANWLVSLRRRGSLHSEAVTGLARAPDQ